MSPQKREHFLYLWLPRVKQLRTKLRTGDVDEHASLLRHGMSAANLLA